MTTVLLCPEQKSSCCCTMFLSSGITAIKARYERQFVIALPGIRCNGWGQQKGEKEWLIWNEWALDSASAWHIYEWSGAIRYLILFQPGTDMSGQGRGAIRYFTLPQLGTDTSGHGRSGTWLCLSLAQTQVVSGNHVLDSASAWHRHEEQGLWSGAMRYLNLPQPGTDMKNKDCGPGRSGTWICLSLAQTWRTRTVVQGDQVLESASAWYRHERTRTVVQGDQVLESTSAWHRHEWSGAIRYLTLPHLGTNTKNKNCGQGRSGTWLPHLGIIQRTIYI